MRKHQSYLLKVRFNYLFNVICQLALCVCIWLLLHCEFVSDCLMHFAIAQTTFWEQIPIKTLLLQGLHSCVLLLYSNVFLYLGVHVAGKRSGAAAVLPSEGHDGSWHNDYCFLNVRFIQGNSEGVYSGSAVLLS